MSDKNIKNSFQKVKADIDELRYELESIKSEIFDIKELFFKLNKENLSNLSVENTSTHPTNPSTHPTNPSTHSTHDPALESLKSPNSDISTRNQGVPTDRQTNRQTNRQTDFTNYNNYSTINNAADILDSLDNIKKEIRLKFKRLTEQEFLVFSTLYQLELEEENVNYKRISEKLSLTESSIRDYIGRLIKKGIPVDKIRLNNKNIQLKISNNLKKIATLPTIIQLRGI